MCGKIEQMEKTGQEMIYIKIMILILTINYYKV